MPPHYQEQGYSHFLTFSCFQERPLLFNTHLRDRLVRQIQVSRERLNFRLFAYVVMPSHVHLLLEPASDQSISEILSVIKRPFSHHALNYLKQSHPELAEQIHVRRKGKWIYRFWQAGGGYDRTITNMDTFRKTIEYIHGNPYELESVHSMKDWRWSSERFWSEGDISGLEMDIPEQWNESKTRR